jgi:AraC-like DNA-binding protein
LSCNGFEIYKLAFVNFDVLISSILNTIILFGALQGFIISCLLFFSRNRRQADRLLGMLIFLLTLASINVWLNKQGWFQSGLFQTLDVLVPMVIIMPVGPILYFYQRSLLDPEFKLGKKQRLHFALTLIDLVPSITCIGFILGVLTGLVANRPGPVGYFIDTYNIYADIPRWLSITIYLALSIYRLRQYRKLNGQTAAAEPVKWLRQLHAAFIAFGFISLCYLLPYVVPAYTNKMVRIFYWYPIYVPLAVLIYWLGIKGYLQRQHTASNKKEKQSILRTDIVENTIKTLQKVMEKELLYLDSSLDLNRLAQHTGIPVKTLSAVLNQHLLVSFNDFVNRYRVAAFIDRYQKPENDNLTIMGIASDCGFSSQPTFQRAFKQVMGMSPRDYKHTTLKITIKTMF